MQYNPFIDLQPPKSVIRDCIKEFNMQASKLLQDIRDLRQNPVGSWLVEEKEREHAKLIHKIRSYQHYVDGTEASGNRELLLQRAKAYPLQELFQGKLRKMGNKLTGICPFHSDGSPSFVIYPNNTFTCFGCSRHGDSIDFIMNRDKVTFNEALKLLT